MAALACAQLTVFVWNIRIECTMSHVVIQYHSFPPPFLPSTDSIFLVRRKTKFLGRKAKESA